MKRLTDDDARGLRVGDRVWCPEETGRVAGRVVFADRTTLVVEWVLALGDAAETVVSLRERQFAIGDRHPRATVANLWR